MFSTKSIRWDELEGLEAAGKGTIVLRGGGKTVMVAPRVLIAPEGEILAAIQAARASRRA